MNPWLFCRSIICTPGVNPEQFEKGFLAGSDAVLLDLEDSVPMEHKELARNNVAEFLANRKNNRLWAVRLNKLSSMNGLSDVMALLKNDARPDMVVFSKAESAYEVEMVHRLFSENGLDIDCSAVIETARGMANINEIANSPKVKMLFFGAADFSLDLSIKFSWRSLEQARFQVVLAAASANVVATDAPYFQLNSMDGLAHECNASRGMGFTCKVALNPDQITVINEAFSPSPKSLMEARHTLEANQLSQGEITLLNGHMIGPPFVKMAERTLQVHHQQNALAASIASELNQTDSGRTT